MPQNTPQSPFLPLTKLSTKVLEGLDKATAETCLTAVTQACQSATVEDSNPLYLAVGRLMRQLERNSAMGAIPVSAALQKVCRCLPPEHDLQLVTALVTSLAGDRAGQNKDFKTAASRQDWAIRQLSSHWNQDALQHWSYAMERRVHWLCRDEQLDAAKHLLQQLLDCAATANNGWVLNRTLEACARWCDHALGTRYEEIIEPATAALALPIHNPNDFTHECFWDLYGFKAEAQRSLDLLYEALETCRQARDYPHKAVTKIGRRSLAWCLAEGAFISAKKLETELLRRATVHMARRGQSWTLLLASTTQKSFGAVSRSTPVARSFHASAPSVFDPAR